MTDSLERHLLGQAADERIGFWHRVRARAVLACVPLDAPSVVADIGAGAGSLGAVLAAERPKARYTFYEPLATLAAQLTDRHGTDAALRSFDDVGGADVVAALDVMEHVEDDRDFARSIVSAMAPGASLVLTVPALPLLWSGWDVALGHHRRYTRATLRHTFDGLPLRVVEVSYLFPEMLPPALVRRVTRREGDDGEAADFPVFSPAVDRGLYAVSRASFERRRWAPAGTSLLISGVRTRS